MKKFSQSRTPPHVMESIQRVVRAGAPTIDTGIDFGSVMRKISQSKAPSHVVESMQRVVRAGARAIDTGVSNSVRY